LKLTAILLKRHPWESKYFQEATFLHKFAEEI